MSVSSTIDALVADLKPAGSIKPRNGAWIVLAGTLLALAGVFAIYGFRADILAIAPDPLVTVRGGLLALLGLAATLAATQAAQPSVGPSQNGWIWALAAALILPAAMVLLFAKHLIAGTPFPPGSLDFAYAPHCFGISLVSALVIGTGLTLWLRRGAATAIARAGWLVGLASGSLGTFAYSLHCPSNSIYYIGIFYSMAVGLSAAIGRLAVPRFIRW